MADDEPKKMAIIASQGSLDWAYPPFILASTAAAMGIETKVFFTFYGLPLLKPDIKAKVTPAANPAMPMKMPWSKGVPEPQLADSTRCQRRSSGL